MVSKEKRKEMEFKFLLHKNSPGNELQWEKDKGMKRREEEEWMRKCYLKLVL